MFWENFLVLCAERGISPNAVAKELLMSSGSVSAWKAGRVPKFATIKKIADYFGIAPDDLLRDASAEDAEGDEEQGSNAFYSNFLALCQVVQKKPEDVLNEIGLPPSRLTSWKAGHAPKWGTIYNIAGYFRIPIVDLIGDASQLAKRQNDIAAVPKQDIRMIPLYESVSAGFGAAAIDEVVDYMPLYIPSFAEACQTLCIKVHGDSMQPRIEDGDIIQVVKQDSVDSGSIAVILLDGDQGLVKKVVYGESWIELHSENPLYKTMRFNGPDVLRVRVVGLVKKIIKSV